MTTILWKSDSPVSIMLDFLKYFRWFARIKSIQDGFEEFFQQAGLLIKIVGEYKLQKSFKATCSNLRFRKQRTKIDSSCSDWANVTRGIPKWSILGPLIFNIFLFFNIRNFADGNRLFSCRDNLSVTLEHDSFKMVQFKFAYSKFRKFSIYNSWEIPSTKTLSCNRAN